MASIFISHASPDRAFAVRLAHDLQQLGHTVWVDAHKILVGDSIPHAIASAVEQAEYLIVVLSQQGTASAWSEQEWEAKYWDEVASRKPMVLPVLLETCAIPFFLRPKRYADFRTEYAVGFAQLALSLQARPGTPASLHGQIHYETDRTRLRSSVVSSDSPVCYTGATMQPRGRLAEVTVELNLPYIGKLAGMWTPDDRERDAAWELYVELVTRSAVAELAPGDGLLRESLTSLYSVFTTTREILRRYGPAVARPKGKDHLSFGYLAITVLNYVVRPTLATWHPLLLAYEQRRDAAISAVEHEQQWERAPELRRVLDQTRDVLVDYADLLAQLSGVPTALVRH